MIMWRPDLKPGFLKAGARYTQSDWLVNNNLLTDRSELQRATAYQVRQNLRCARGNATSQICWATRSTKNHLTCRVDELNVWQSQSVDSIACVDQEITALEQVKAMAETCLQQKALYRLVLGECVTLRDGRKLAELVRDHVGAELRREVDLAEEITALIQNRILVLLDQLRALREMRTQLMADSRDKVEAAKLISHCLSFDRQSPNLGYKYQPCHIAKGTLSYDQWMAHCQDLKQASEKLVLDCAYLRGNLQYSLAKMGNALESQRCATDFCFRRRLNELSQARDTLEWEKQQLKDAVVELVKEMQKVEKQIMNSGSEQQLAQTRLDVLAQRSNYELCMDKAHVGLLQETQNLTTNTSGLQKKLRLSQQTLESMHRNLMALQDNLAVKTHALDTDRKCQEVRRRLAPLSGHAVVTANAAEPQL